MPWFLIIAGAVLVLVLLLAFSGRKKTVKGPVAQFRTHFPHIARLRLVAACPGLDGVLQERDLRMIFDWMLLQLYGRTHTSGLEELMQWTLEHGEGESLGLVSDVSRDAVDRLPAPVLAVIDGCEGRIVASVIIDQALSESGKRIRPGTTS
jgi:hypothetical protein